MVWSRLTILTLVDDALCLVSHRLHQNFVRAGILVSRQTDMGFRMRLTPPTQQYKMMAIAAGIADPVFFSFFFLLSPVLLFSSSRSAGF